MLIPLFTLLQTSNNTDCLLGVNPWAYILYFALLYLCYSGELPGALSRVELKNTQSGNFQKLKINMNLPWNLGMFDISPEKQDVNRVC